MTELVIPLGLATAERVTRAGLSIADGYRRVMAATHPGHAVYVALVLGSAAYAVTSYAATFPHGGLPNFGASTAIDVWARQAAFLGFYAWVALMVRRDFFLAAAVLLVGLTSFGWGGLVPPTHTALFCVGVLGLHAMRALHALDARAHVFSRRLLVGVGVFQAVYMLIQAWGYDPLWGRWDGGALGLVQTLGTLGTVDGASAYVAVITPLMPPPLMLLGAGAVIVSKSAGAMLALAVGLALRFRHRVSLLKMTLALLSALYVALWWSSHNAHTLPFNKLAQSIYGRLAVAEVGLQAWWGTFTGSWSGQWSVQAFGWGLGGWQEFVPRVQVQYRRFPTPELWAEAHNDAFQFLCEAGIVGFCLLLAWAWTHRRAIAGPWGPAVGALGVVSLTFFPFHVVPLAFVAIVIVGAATSPLTAGGSTL